MRIPNWFAFIAVVFALLVITEARLVISKHYLPFFDYLLLLFYSNVTVLF